MLHKATKKICFDFLNIFFYYYFFFAENEKDDEKMHKNNEWKWRLHIIQAIQKRIRCVFSLKILNLLQKSERLEKNCISIRKAIIMKLIFFLPSIPVFHYIIISIMVQLAETGKGRMRFGVFKGRYETCLWLTTIREKFHFVRTFFV